MRLALAGDTMLGRGVAEALATSGPRSLFAPELPEVAAEADLFVLNLECCISGRGERWPDPRKPFFFRAPPVAVEALGLLGVDAVTLANNHALDYGYEALTDTLDLLDAAGIARTGAGRDITEARRPAHLEVDGTELAVIGLSDHPDDFAAADDLPGIALADLRADPLPQWLAAAIGRSDADIVVVTPHWGPNMTASPVPHVERSAAALVGAGATLVAGHSAHVFHGVRPPILYDLGDFVDDYAVDPVLRNDLGLLWFVDFEEGTPVRYEAVPLALDFCHTRPADPAESEWIATRLREACAAMGSEVAVENGRLVIG